MDAVSIIAFRAESNDLTVVADLLSKTLFGGIPFSKCTSGRMGAFPAVQLDRDILGLSIYLAHMNSRDPHEYTLELECDDPSNRPTDKKRGNLSLTNGVLLSDFVAEHLKVISGIQIPT